MQYGYRPFNPRSTITSTYIAYIAHTYGIWGNLHAFHFISSSRSKRLYINDWSPLQNEQKKKKTLVAPSSQLKKKEYAFE